MFTSIRRFLILIPRFEYLDSFSQSVQETAFQLDTTFFLLFGKLCDDTVENISIRDSSSDDRILALAQEKACKS